MKRALLAAVLLACASAPRPKAPDESHRIPVNESVPPEAAHQGPPETPRSGDSKAREGVVWR